MMRSPLDTLHTPIVSDPNAKYSKVQSMKINLSRTFLLYYERIEILKAKC